MELAAVDGPDPNGCYEICIENDVWEVTLCFYTCEGAEGEVSGFICRKDTAETKPFDGGALTREVFDAVGARIQAMCTHPQRQLVV